MPPGLVAPGFPDAPETLRTEPVLYRLLLSRVSVPCKFIPLTAWSPHPAPLLRDSVYSALIPRRQFSEPSVSSDDMPSTFPVSSSAVA